MSTFAKYTLVWWGMVLATGCVMWAITGSAGVFIIAGTGGGLGYFFVVALSPAMTMIDEDRVKSRYEAACDQLVAPAARPRPVRRMVRVRARLVLRWLRRTWRT